jgi:hypothetical protein
MAERVGGEFLVNTTTENAQGFPSVTDLADGGFVVTWTDYSQLSFSVKQDIRGQAYNSDGSARGGEFLINTTTEDTQWDPSVTDLADGGFVVTWEDRSETGGDTDGEAVRGQAFNADGTRRGDEFLVNSFSAGRQQEPSVTGLSDGGFVVAWESANLQSNDFDVAARLFDANGAPRGSEFTVNSITVENQDDPSVSSLSDGGFVVVWGDGSGAGEDTRPNAIRGQAYNADGTVRGGEFLVNTTTFGNQDEPSVSSLTGGGFVVTWESRQDLFSPRQIQGQVYSADGAPQGGEFVIDSSRENFLDFVNVTDLADGGFVVTWMTDPADPLVETLGQIRGQVYNGDGTARGTDFLVASDVSNSPTTEDPSLAGLSNGSFIVTWVDRSETGGDNDTSSIRAQIFDATGTATPKSLAGNDRSYIKRLRRLFTSEKVRPPE